MSQRLRVMLGSLPARRHHPVQAQHRTCRADARPAQPTRRRPSHTPMFLCVDMEGGTVDRLRDVIAPVPSVSEVAAAGSKKLFRQHGRLIGDEVRALGFNTDFAPVFDLRVRGSRRACWARAPSPRSRKRQFAYAREFLRGLRDCGVLGCGKHFPGLGRGQPRHAPRAARPSTRRGRRCGRKTCFPIASCTASCRS